MKNKIFYIKDFSILRTGEELYIAEIPPLVRRKLSELDKIGYSTMSKIYDMTVQEIVFSSKVGEIGRLNNLIQQYNDMNEVSPTYFSSSVHNYLVGFFALFKKINIPYSAIASGDNSLSAGIIKSLISQNQNVLFTYADDSSVSCIFSKNSGKIKFEFHQRNDSNTEISHNEFDNFEKFLKGEVKLFETVFGNLVRIDE